ncbi:glutamate--cysteine ligase [Wenzhouxiangella sp. XN79A]|uniref:glutamate--cysteine ligase n=1 Tax=Wenzhouxiangella sp. XN79A TaxID=2724193 RepID=UPI00144AD955|nr:glutamate--cysteine ligase [Wenzhouxiangella sp. XN79A]NKI33842.1 glutamate--cysteine ligase [Wenzhouxiangella sp. XN79A]
MTDSPTTAHEPIGDPRTLVEHLASGCRPVEDWKIGTEHEKFAFRLDDRSPVPYEGEHGIGALLRGLAERYAWTPEYEGDNVIALKRDGCSITLEPGGQFELSGDLLDHLHQTCNEVNSHLAEVRAVAEPMGLGFLGLGFHPTAKREDIPWMPKARYRIMRAHMPRVGSLGLDMMTRTCTVQVNLDFSSEADMAAKFRAGLALQPIATALFANSPFLEGKPSGYVSYRSHIWTDTDPQRTGQLPFVFEQDFGFERYVDWMLDVPMYFVRRGGRYIDASGQSFRDFIDGKLPALPGERPTLADWDDHLTTAFPEVRLKKFLEMRGADGGPWKRLCALPAFWVGLLYDAGSLDACQQLIADWSTEALATLREDVSRDGLRAEIGGRTVREIAGDLLELAQQGLGRRKRLNAAGDDETGFLEPLHATVESGRTPADKLLELYDGEWSGSLEPLFRTRAYY